MQDPRLTDRLQAYEAWKRELAGAVEHYQTWLDREQLGVPEADLPIFEALEALRTDRLTIAFVAEFSRGKSELINAIFFADAGRRLLPSDAGRTTMCPTELFFDRESERAYLRLLPIETRATDRSVADYRNDPSAWHEIALDTAAADQMTVALQEITRVKRVHADEARRLGLHDHDNRSDDTVEIPLWRHALISFPHPLLRQGLVVLDTPGLNALGSEPELTLNMLPSAQAVLFVVAADAGVTRSDMDIWQHHVAGLRRHGDRRLCVAMNKVDMLWDELKDQTSVDAAVDRQRTSTANHLGISAQDVFPVSAQKGLVAKIRGDEPLLVRSRLPALEHHLCTEVLPAKERIVRATVVDAVGAMMDGTAAIVAARLQEYGRQLQDLQSLRGKNADVIMQLLARTRAEQTAYVRSVESFQTSRRILSVQAGNLLDSLGVDALDALIDATRREMTTSWTTAGIRRGMRTFFEGARIAMQEAMAQAEQTRGLIQSIYRKFHQEHGLPPLQPKVFSMTSFYAAFDRLQQDADEFRNSPVTAATEQAFVIRKFFVSLASHARELFRQAGVEAECWFNEALTPLVSQIREHKLMMEKRLETLRKISESRDGLEARIAELEIQCRTLRRQQEELSAMRAALTCAPPDRDSAPPSLPVARTG